MCAGNWEQNSRSESSKHANQHSEYHQHDLTDLTFFGSHLSLLECLHSGLRTRRIWLNPVLLYVWLLAPPKSRGLRTTASRRYSSALNLCQKRTRCTDALCDVSAPFLNCPDEVGPVGTTVDEYRAIWILRIAN